MEDGSRPGVAPIGTSERSKAEAQLKARVHFYHLDCQTFLRTGLE